MKADAPTPPAARRKQLNPWLKIALDLGPLILFFVANAKLGIFAGTAVFMVSVIAALVVSYALTRHLPIMALVSAFVVLVFGGMTLILHDQTFIKVKPTIIYVLFAVVLFGGLVMRKPLLSMVFDQVFHLTEEGWRRLTWRWAAFFLVLAVLNEIVWRTQTTDVWVAFKAFGTVPLTLVFAMLQYPLIVKYDDQKETAEKP